MKKMTITLVGDNLKIEEAEVSIGIFLGDLLSHYPYANPSDIKYGIKVEEIDYEHRDEYVVVSTIANEVPCGQSLEKALKIALDKVKNGEEPETLTIQRCAVSYLDGEYDGINGFIKIIAHVKNIV